MLEKGTMMRFVENESDYNRLFLVIDDPVSSMDFNYVYNVSV